MRPIKLAAATVLVLVIATVIMLHTSQVYAGVYNRSSAVAWADAHAKDRPSNYPSYGTGDGCNDCTNFISQVLAQGGVPQIRGSNDAFRWYAYKVLLVWNVSKTWAATDWLNTHASQYQSSRYQYISGGPSTLGAGDFFVMNLPTNPFNGPDHGRVVLGWGTVQEGDQIGQWRLLGSQHCVDRKRVRWDYNIPGGTPIWAWRVIY